MYDKKAVRYLAAILLMLAQAAIAAPPALSYDPVNPVSLNEFAMQRVRDGDLGTALIMLERAALIAPYDTRIQANLQTLRDLKAGKPVDIASNQATKPDDASVQKTNTATQEAPAMSSDVPVVPLWPRK